MDLPLQHMQMKLSLVLQFDGIPLVEINKTHNGISSPTLDSYDITTTSIATLGNTVEIILSQQNIQ